ncbi:MAG: ACP S-malonyltransferase [Pseudomonadota bacterium]
MTGARRTALLVCPGRGTYNKDELGYLARHHAEKPVLLEAMDGERRRLRQTSLQSLDSTERYSVAQHTRGDNASLLIHACARGDVLDIDTDQFEIVAATGNSMGWYIALSCTGVVSEVDGARIVNTMGTYMQEALIGGQIVYPLVNDQWQVIPGRRSEVLELAVSITASGQGYAGLSIDLGGMLVLAGDEPGLAALTDRLDPVDRFPMRLQNHAAFHTVLQTPISERGHQAFSNVVFAPASIPLIDGRGAIWRRNVPYGSDIKDYTFGAQVVEPYDFAAALRVGLREFAPDVVILPGPGSTLGSAIAQTMIAMDWRGISSKDTFLERQASDPVLLSMGRDDQRSLVSRP